MNIVCNNPGYHDYWARRAATFDHLDEMQKEMLRNAELMLDWAGTLYAMLSALHGDSIGAVPSDLIAQVGPIAECFHACYWQFCRSIGKSPSKQFPNVVKRFSECVYHFEKYGMNITVYPFTLKKELTTDDIKLNLIPITPEELIKRMQTVYEDWRYLVTNKMLKNQEQK